MSRFESVNTEIIKGTRSGADVTDYLDQRDQILKQVSEQIGIKTISRANNDMAIYTDSGVTLFDVTARSISFQPTSSYTAGTTGNAVYADGVPITGSSATMSVGSGRINGLVKVRDDLTVTYQGQLDEVARGLITAFAESDQSATPTLPDVPGLFTWGGAPPIPPGGTITPGLAGSININALVDPDQGGNATLLRDGGIGGAAYKYNSTGVAGYNARLDQLVDKLNGAQAFDPASKLSSSTNLKSFASASAAWLEQSRSTASDDADYREALLVRSSDALTKVTGVNLDEEMTLMLELERTYQASSKLISTIDQMLQTLMASVG
ncbi:MAG: flagellar hook-associated protein FlgK [Hyphomicrobium sp.]